MKKFLLVLAALAFAGSTAFAADLFTVGDTGSVSLGSWGRTEFVPFTMNDPDGNEENDETVGMGTGPAWANADGAFRINSTLNANLGAVGFTAGVFYSPSGGAITSDAEATNVWVKPFDWMELKYGGFTDGTFRGTHAINGFGGYDYYGGGASTEDGVFPWMATRGADAGKAFQLKLTPIEGLTFMWNSIVAAGDAGAGEKSDDAKYTGYDKMIAASKIAVGYDIAGIGLFRVGYFGDGKVNDSKNDATKSATITANEYIQAAFKLTAVEGLTIDLGAKIPLNMKSIAEDEDTYGWQPIPDHPESQPQWGPNPGPSTAAEILAAYNAALGSVPQVSIALAGGYTADALNIGFGLSIGLENTEWEKDMGYVKPMNFGLTLAPKYDLGSLAIGATIGMNYAGDDKGMFKSVLSIGALPYVAIPLAGTTLNIGFEFLMTNRTPQTGDAVSDVTVALPIRFDYSF
jgi:hypothetical protein